MKKVKFLLLTLVSSLLYIIAMTSVASACYIAHYQPETPKSLIR